MELLNPSPSAMLLLQNTPLCRILSFLVFLLKAFVHVVDVLLVLFTLLSAEDVGGGKMRRIAGSDFCLTSASTSSLVGRSVGV